MSLGEKLQELRKRKGLTQEELAEILFVSRTAISKWESGRGNPNIDSLKAISKFFGVTIDELLSGDELLTIAEEDSRQKDKHYCDLVFGLLDCSVSMFFFLPFFGQRENMAVQASSLLTLSGISDYLQVTYLAAVSGIVLIGVLILALQTLSKPIWVMNKYKISLAFNGIGALILIMSLQPYAATLLFVFLGIKALMLIKWP